MQNKPGNEEVPWNADCERGRLAAEQDYLSLRGVRTPCGICHGLGTRAYGSGATWRGGMGAATITYDVCDKCWGTGDKHMTGVDLRKMMEARAAWEQEQCQKWLAMRLGINLCDTRQRIQDLATLADKQAGRRKLPADADEFGWRRTWESIAAVLRELSQ